ncbi:hypothetical protein KP003_16570 [Geomonas nitrogeniifigens]|uniref:hypothetical protein n=1 Tax=Geomonas diazotrophica TaxID=2843197 RepID=UPI001C2C7B5A|nr:hypothetical protein [Geomonas nitrogeniifigens]QXE85955.1 hypothetical protein KP003_16570 [Geomonas nitrogeniifigens]
MTTTYIYTAPFIVGQSSTLRAVAIDSSGNIGAVQTVAYVMTPSLYFTSQPSLSAPTDDGGIISYGTVDPLAEDAVIIAAGSATVTDVATLRDASAALITAGVSATNVNLMTEALTVAAESAAVITDTLQSVEAALAEIDAFPTVSDLLTLASGITAPFAWSAQPALVSSTADGGVIAYSTYDTGFDDVTSTADVSIQVAELLAKVDNLLTTVEAVPSVADLLAQVEAITSTAQAVTEVADVKLSGVADSLLFAADAIAEVTDLQLLVDNVTVMAVSGAGTDEIAAYVDQATTAATVGASVTDTLLGLFIGRYLFLNTCPPRSFSDMAPPRNYTNYCSPRGIA